MIGVNFQPWRQNTFSRWRKGWLLGLSLQLLVGGLGLLAASISLSDVLVLCLSSQEQLRTEFAVLQKNVTEYQQLEAFHRAHLQRQRADGVLKERLQMKTQYLIHFSQLRPEHLWLSRIHDKEKEIRLDGETFHHIALMEFVRQLKQGSLFEDIRVEKILTSSISGQLRFTLSLKKRQQDARVE